MNIQEIEQNLIYLREITNEEADITSCNDSYYFYVLNAYLLLKELNLNPILLKGAGRTWVELITKQGNIYVVDLNFENPIIKKEETFSANVDGIEIELEDFLNSWPEKEPFVKTRRWSKQVLPHKVYESPGNLSQKPKKKRPPPYHAPILRPHKRI